MTQETAPLADPQTAAQEPAPPAGRPAGTSRRRRPARQDPLLADSAALARAAVEEIADPAHIGGGHRVEAEEDRLVVHLLECTLPGYRGWNWFASLARAPRSKTVTVCEVGLLPGDGALLAPEWVPWAERVSPEEKAHAEPDSDDPAGGPGGVPGAQDAPEDSPAAGPVQDPTGAGPQGGGAS